MSSGLWFLKKTFKKLSPWENIQIADLNKAANYSQLENVLRLPGVINKFSHTDTHVISTWVSMSTL